ncbi:MAG: hypothetical protein QOF62_2190 [Pyrinomonadaceae bacterium]|jgi:hypothetical protein|nr:hypothetical protein [Pyrinomonadaceae bacterium]
MTRSKLFIGSSQKNLRVAQVLAESLEEHAEVTIWNEGLFGLNQSNLENLIRTLTEFDFAAFILAPDDITESKGEAKASPRDNVLFESGLFMGVLGRERVFLVHDEKVALKIPSDLAGITLAGYDSSRIGGTEAPAAVRKAARIISDAINAARYPHLVGLWRSVYPMTFEEGDPLVDETLEIRPCRGGILLQTKESTLQDFYTAFGSLSLERQITGTWKSVEAANDMQGVFVLTVLPTANVMYGYFTSPDQIGGVVYATWVLAKMTGADGKPVTPEKLDERIKKAQELLKTKTVSGPTPS